jgi:general stress protein YciG
MSNSSHTDFEYEPHPKPEDEPHTEVDSTTGEQSKTKRGTAAMDPETRKEVARKGGLAVSKNRAHMALIGKKGGQTISRDREHMARIGKKGGQSSRAAHAPPRPGLTTASEIAKVAPKPEEAAPSPEFPTEKTGTES